jgi:hypothetical protein
MNTKEKKNDGFKRGKNVKTYTEVDLEKQLICSISEINKLKKKNLKQKDKL